MSFHHIYHLPPHILPLLIPRFPPPEAPSQPEHAPSPSHGPLSCNVCLAITFTDVEQQRAHARSDWHRYNVKTKLAGGKPVDESAFSHLLNALDDSLSGSASSSESDDDGDDDGNNNSDAVNVLVNKTKKLLKPTTNDDGDSQRPTIPVTALTWFHSPPSTQIGVYRAVFPLGTQIYLDQLKAMQQQTEGEGRTWALFMVAGGHFAGAIVRVSCPAAEDEEKDGLPGPGKKKTHSKQQKPDIEVLKHKTFHRYTTRRKQGGSQSLNDNSKGAAISAGAMLRRYGEQALRDDIRTLLADWADDIDQCERIWIRANVSNRRIFLDYEGAVIHKGDERLRTFPFPTRRPTQSELQRCLLELIRVKVTHFTEDELRVQDEAYLASLPKPKPPPTTTTTTPQSEPAKPKPPKLTKEEEVLREKWARLLDMISKGRLEPLKGFWEREGEALGGVNTTIPEWTGDNRASLLQVATQSGHEDVIQWLLEDLRADPTIPARVEAVDGNEKEEENNGSAPGKRTAYDLARTRGVRDVFRRCADAHPDWWDWFGAARVPSALSKEMEEERDEKKKVRRKGLKDKIKEREAREKERAKEKEVQQVPEAIVEVKVKEQDRNPFIKRLGGTSGAMDAVEGLPPEMRARVERERRARAAEARLAARH